MQSGFSWRGTVIVDPLVPEPDRRLTLLLGIGAQSPLPTPPSMPTSAVAYHSQADRRHCHGASNLPIGDIVDAAQKVSMPVGPDAAMWIPIPEPPSRQRYAWWLRSPPTRRQFTLWLVAVLDMAALPTKYWLTSQQQLVDQPLFQSSR